jgi:hypothetical protein
VTSFLLDIAVGWITAGGAVIFLWWAFEMRKRGNDDESRGKEMPTEAGTCQAQGG